MLEQDNDGSWIATHKPNGAAAEICGFGPTQHEATADWFQSLSDSYKFSLGDEGADTKSLREIFEEGGHETAIPEVPMVLPDNVAEIGQLILDQARAHSFPLRCIGFSSRGEVNIDFSYKTPEGCLGNQYRGCIEVAVDGTLTCKYAEFQGEYHSYNFEPTKDQIYFALFQIQAFLLKAEIPDDVLAKAATHFAADIIVPLTLSDTEIQKITNDDLL